MQFLFAAARRSIFHSERNKVSASNFPALPRLLAGQSSTMSETKFLHSAFHHFRDCSQIKFLLYPEQSFRHTEHRRYSDFYSVRTARSKASSYSLPLYSEQCFRFPQNYSSSQASISSRLCSSTILSQSSRNFSRGTPFIFLLPRTLTETVSFSTS